MEDIALVGPGEYLPDVTQGISNSEDLPKRQILERSRNYRNRPCITCGHSAYRLKTASRTLHDLGDPAVGRPRDLHIRYSQHRCRHCNTYFNADMDDLASPGAHYTHRVIATAVRLVIEDGLSYEGASWHLWRDHRVFVPWATIQNWVEAGGKKGGRDHRTRVSRSGAGPVLRLHRRR